jgi:integrase
VDSVVWRRLKQDVDVLTRMRLELDGLAARVAALEGALLFPAERGGHINLANWRTRDWYPALDAAGVRKRGPYHLRHTFATEALAASMPVFILPRVMGCSVQMVERHYGHLAHDSEQTARALLDARAASNAVLVASKIGPPPPIPLYV